MSKTTELAVKFAQLIENYPCLYNKTLAEYSRKNITEKAWSTIATEMQWSVADCKEKWRNMRSNFLRSLKGPPSGSSVKPKKQYHLHDIMQYLIPYVKPVRHTEDNTSNIVLCGEDILMDAEEIKVQTEEIFTDSINNTKRCNSDVDPFNQTKKRQKTADVDDKVADTVLQLVKAKREKKVNEVSGSRKLFLLSMLTDVETMTEQEYLDFRIHCLMGIQNCIANRTENSTSQFVTPSSSNSFVTTPANSPNGLH